MEGYSNTPLVRKLGIKPGARLAFVNVPEGFVQALGELPEEIVHVTEAERLDFGLLFAPVAGEMHVRLPELAGRLEDAGMIWVAWPKKASGVPTDLSYGEVQRAGLALELVDVKVCAVDAVWSALKFVRRKADRKARA